MKLTGFKALTSDAYGVLIEREGGMVVGLKPLTDRLESQFSDDVVGVVHEIHKPCQQKCMPGKPYSEILAIVYKWLAVIGPVAADWDAGLAHGQSVKHGPAFPNAAEALPYLKQYAGT